MKVIKHFPQGTFSWVDLATSNIESSKQFYSALFGWNSEDYMFPAESGQTGVMYSNQKLGEHNVAGIGPIMDENLPVHWNSYISVDNVDDVVEKVKQNNGTIVMEPMDVMESGRMALIQDPTGAYLSLWQAGNHIGAQHCNVPGSLVWNDLGTHDIEKAKEFYTNVFGWEYNVQSNGGMDYYMVLNNGRNNAGMFQMPEFMGDTPSMWSVYFMVEDIDRAKEIIINNGGKVQMENDAEVGKMAMIIDNLGAMFWIIEAKMVDEIPDEWCE